MATSKKSGRKPPTQYPFPRDVTRPITGPALEAGDTPDDARKKWHEWLGVVARLRQMDLPARSKRKET
jgi:hypothetical protein